MGFSGDVSSEVLLTFKLFKFKFTNQLTFRITIKLCKGTGACNATVRKKIPLHCIGLGMGARKKFSKGATIT